MREIVEMKADLEHLKSAFGQSIRVGPVAEIDAAKGYRLKLGEGEEGAPFLSPWLPHPETGKTSVPLKLGQIVGVVAASGNLRQGLVFRGGYGGGNDSPNADMAANVFEDAGVRITIAGGALRIEAGGSTVEISGEGIRMVAPRIDLN